MVGSRECSFYSAQMVPWLLWEVVDGVASPVLEGAMQGRRSSGDGMAMLRMLLAWRKGDGSSQKLDSSAAVPAVLLRRGRRRQGRRRLASVSTR
jgi:hypothetical protein